jgi:iron complex transport system substrate-binding protein
MDIDEVSGGIVDAAVHVHRGLGPGLLESVYEAVLARELQRRGFRVERHRAFDFEFEGMRFENALRLDLLVNGIIAVELKSVETLAPVHWKQLLTYLRLLDLRVGLLINFGAARLTQDLQRVVNRYDPPPSSHTGSKRLPRSRW